MTEKRWDLREIARSALNEMPPRDRVPFLAEMLCEVEGPEALNLLAGARNAITLHMQDLIDEAMGEDGAIPALSGELSGPGFATCSGSASTPWEGVNSRERAVAFLEGASGEDIDLMARLLLEGRPIPDAWRPAQAHIASALSSSAGLLRRMTSARAEAVAPRKMRWRPRGSAQGGRS